MKQAVVFLLLALSFQAFAQDQDKDKKQKPTLRSILLEQLKTTHNQKDWFVDANTAVAGVTPEQGNWMDGHGNHSVGQLAYHLVYWNERSLAKFRGQTPSKFDGNNDETFNQFDAKKWADTVRRLDQVMTDLEKVVETADEKNFRGGAPRLAPTG